MKLKERTRTVEYAIGLGTLAGFGWMLLGNYLLRWLAGFGLSPGLGTQALVGTSEGLLLVAILAVAGLVAGLMGVESRWVFGIGATALAVLLRYAFLAVVSPSLPFDSIMELCLHGLLGILAVVVSARMAALGDRLGRPKEPPKEPPKEQI